MVEPDKDAGGVRRDLGKINKQFEEWQEGIHELKGQLKKLQVELKGQQQT